MATLSEYFYTGPRITLNSGRVINMQTIYQGLAYSYVLEGIDTKCIRILPQGTTG